MQSRRRASWARELFGPLAARVGGRVTAPRIGTPSLRLQTPGGEAKLSLLRQKGQEVSATHLRLRIPASTAEGEVTRVRTKPTRVTHVKGEVLDRGTGLPDRWHVQSTHPSRARALLDGEVGRRLAAVDGSRRVAVELRQERVTIRWGEPVDPASALELLELGTALREAAGRQGTS